MEFLKPPDPLRFSGDISRNWKLFIQKFNLFLASPETTDQKPRPEYAKGALLLSIAGEEAIEVYNTFTFAEGESNLDYATVVKKFEEYCDAQQNEVYERYVFRKRVQEPGCVQRRYRMVLREGAKPVVQTTRRVPLALQEPLKEELQRMERAGIAVKVKEPTDWGSSWCLPTCYHGLQSKATGMTSLVTTQTCTL
ncbi:uncharacterized protein LOC144167016 isoform X2 [Haemaphysalis longicornis]